MPTVIDRAAGAVALRKLLGYHQRTNIGEVLLGSRDGYHRLRRDMAIKLRAAHHLPATALSANLCHRNTMGIDFLEYFQLRPSTQIPLAPLVKFLA